MGLIENYTGDMKCSNHQIDNGLTLKGASDPANLGALLAIGNGGAVTLRNTPQTDKEWTDSSNQTFNIATAEVKILSVTLTEDVPKENGSWAVTLRVVDTAIFGGTAFHVIMKENGTEVYRSTVTLGAAEQDLVYTQLFRADSANGAVIDIYCSSNASASVNQHNDYASIFTITKAATFLLESEIEDMVDDAERFAVALSRDTDTVKYPVHSKPTKAELTEAFKLLPDYDFAEDRNFFVLDTPQNKVKFVKYIAATGDFHFEKLTKAV